MAKKTSGSFESTLDSMIQKFIDVLRGSLSELFSQIITLSLGPIQQGLADLKSSASSALAEIGDGFKKNSLSVSESVKATTASVDALTAVLTQALQPAFERAANGAQMLADRTRPALSAAPILAIGDKPAGGSKFGEFIKQASESLEGIGPKIVSGAKQFMGLPQLLTTGFTKVASAGLLALAGPVGVFAAATTQAINLMQGFVAKANPAAAFQFNRALDDLAATMGQILTPVLQAVTGFIREYADVLQGMKPVFAPIMKGIADVVGELTKLISLNYSLMIPAYQALGVVIKYGVVPAVKGMTDALFVLKDALDLVTFGLFKNVEKASSVGAAVRPAAYGTIEDIGKRTTLAALNSGAGLTPDGQAITKGQEKTNSTLDKIARLIGGAAPATKLVGAAIDNISDW